MTRVLSHDEARALFDAALDGELDLETQAAFRAALASDQALGEEYARYKGLFSATAQLAADAVPVDLLGGVQQKLRARSGGRFYRDKFAEQRGQRRSASLTALLIASVLVLLGASAFLAFQAGLF